MTLSPLCFVDTETTGVHPDREAWEIALIRRDFPGDDPGAFTETEVSFFVAIDLDKADPFGLKVGRFWDRHPMGRWLASTPEPGDTTWAPDKVREAMELQPAAAHTVARMTHGAHLVGAVPSFDAEVFDRLLRAHGLLPAWHYHLVDVEAMAVGFIAALPVRFVTGAEGPPATPTPTFDFGRLIQIPEPATCTRRAIAPPWKSDDLSRAIGVEPASEEDRHTALGDARWAMRMYDAMTGGAR